MTIPKLPLPAPRSAHSRSALFVLVDDDRLGPVGARRDDDLGRQQVVRGHAEGAGEQSEAAAEGGADETDGSFGAGRRRDSRPCRVGHGFQLVEPGADGRRARRRVDRRRLHLADVDHDPVVDVGPALEAVAAAAHPNRDVVLPRPGQRVDDVLRLLGEHDHCRIVGEEQVPAGARRRVVGVAGTDDPAGQFGRSCRGGGHSVTSGAAAKMSSPGSVSSTSRLKIIMYAK